MTVRVGHLVGGRGVGAGRERGCRGSVELGFSRPSGWPRIDRLASVSPRFATYQADAQFVNGAGRRTATVTATEPGTLWALFGASFRQLQADRPDVATALHNAMSDRLRADREVAAGT
jgi:CRP-like cAMP-binding protein